MMTDDEVFTRWKKAVQSLDQQSPGWSVQRDAKGRRRIVKPDREALYVGMLLDARPSEATAELLAAWVHGIARWPLAKIRRHQRINSSHSRRTPDLDVMVEVYRRAVEVKCFPDSGENNSR